uniref:POU domain protein n=1 Tax=Rhabditophanes sp. KR3021 TaxID=114890 RepID=A0AC35UDJ9_9BILA
MVDDDVQLSNNNAEWMATSFYDEEESRADIHQRSRAQSEDFSFAHLNSPIEAPTQYMHHPQTHTANNIPTYFGTEHEYEFSPVPTFDSSYPFAYSGTESRVSISSYHQYLPQASPYNSTQQYCSQPFEVAEYPGATQEQQTIDAPVSGEVGIKKRRGKALVQRLKDLNSTRNPISGLPLSKIPSSRSSSVIHKTTNRISKKGKSTKLNRKKKSSFPSTSHSSAILRHYNTHIAGTTSEEKEISVDKGISEVAAFLRHHRVIIQMEQMTQTREAIMKSKQDILEREEVVECDYVDDCDNVKNADLLDLENFANYFKSTRIKYGFTQGDVGRQLGLIYGAEVSQTTISRFEALNLSFKNMLKQRPYLNKWLQATHKLLLDGHTPDQILRKGLHLSISSKDILATPNGIVDKEKETETVEEIAKQLVPLPEDVNSPKNHYGLKRRRRRTNLVNEQRQFLNSIFDEEANPDHERMDEIANELKLDKEIIRVWFCNRRQKIRRFAECSEIF